MSSNTSGRIRWRSDRCTGNGGRGDNWSARNGFAGDTSTENTSGEDVSADNASTDKASAGNALAKTNMLEAQNDTLHTRLYEGFWFMGDDRILYVTRWVTMMCNNFESD